MAEVIGARHRAHADGIDPLAGFSQPEADSSGLPPLKHSLTDTDGWITFEHDPLLYIFAGKGPYVSR